jgi:K+/H+ antiporter YhaU regulatory subunit KhtT
MLLGNAGIVTAMSSLILSFMEMRQTEAVPYKITLMICGLVLLWVIASSNWIDRKLSNVISFFLKRYTKMDVKDYSAMLHLAGEYIITELQVEPEDWLADRDLNELKLINEGLIILGITRNNGSYIGAPHGNTLIKPWDTLIIYGRASAVEEIDQRKKNIIGDLAHAEGELKHKELVEEESKTDPVQRKDPSKSQDAANN